VAKTASQVAVTQGSGVGLSTFDLATGRKRQTVVIGDADSTGEQALVELPAHDAPDRGSPLKIGGRASSTILPPVGENDRTDAWFTVSGQLNTVTETSPSYVHDSGRRIIGAQAFSVTNVATQMIAPYAGLKTRVLSIHVVCSNFTSVGTAWLTDGNGGLTLVHLARVTGVGNYLFPSTGYVVATTAVNTGLWWNFDGGAANFGVHMSWYLAP